MPFCTPHRVAVNALKARCYSHLSGDVTITIDARKSHQSIIGFGGAFTDAVGINLRSLSEETQKKLLESYFGKNGKYLYSMCDSLDLLPLNDSID
ncbi:hypothetical protein COOONC_24169 [Cooperia oncophora]